MDSEIRAVLVPEVPLTYSVDSLRINNRVPGHRASKFVIPLVYL
jgi:hypothetical protein